MNQKGLIGVIVLIAFLLIGVGAGAYYLGTKNAVQQKSVEQDGVIWSTSSPKATSNKPIPSSTPLDLKDESDWKTYSVNALYSIKYPPDLPPNVETNQVVCFRGNVSYAICIQHYLNPKKLSLTDLIVSNIGEQFRSNLNLSTQTIGSYNITYTKNIPSQDGQLCKFIDMGGGYNYLQVCLNPYPLLYPHNTTSDDTAAEQVMDTMISSLQFNQ